jgi:hypothetical protein
LGKDGVTFEQYLENLDSITAFPTKDKTAKWFKHGVMHSGNGSNLSE